MDVLQVNENLMLRPLALSDLDECHDLITKNQQYLAKWLSWAKDSTIKKEKNFINAAYSGILAGTKLELGMFLRQYVGRENDAERNIETWKFIGICGMINICRTKGTDSYGEIGYWLDENHSGKGIVTRACAKIIEHAFKSLRLSKLAIACHRDNKRSISVARRLNFKQTDDFLQRPNSQFHNDPKNVILFKLTCEEWETTNRDDVSRLEQEASV